MPDLTRRSVVRAGLGAAWAAPVITLATTAPARASSGDASLEFTGAWMVYRDYEDPALVDPSIIDLQATVRSTGSSAARGPVTFMITMPGSAFDQIDVPAASVSDGFVIASVEKREGDDVWEIIFVHAGSISDEATLLAELHVGSTTESPYLGHRGAYSWADFLVSSVGATPGFFSCDLVETPLATLTDVAFHTDWVGSEMYVTGQNIFVGEDSRSGIGRLTLEITVPRSMGSGEYWPLQNDITEVSPAWRYAYFRDTAEDSWTFGFWSSEEGFAGSLAPVAARGPGEFAAVIPFAGAHGDSIEPTWRLTADHLVDPPS